MTDTLHSRILRTIEDWNREYTLGLSQGNMESLGARIFSVNSLTLQYLRDRLDEHIKLIDRTLNLAENSDAGKERDELTFRLRQCHYSLTILTSRYGHLGASKEVIEEVEKLLKIVTP